MRFKRTAALVAVAILGVAACGSDKDKAATTTAAPGGPTTTAAESGGGAGTSGAPETTGGAAPSGDPIVIGMDEDSTGSGASYAVVAGKTVRDVVAKVNAEGGVLGRPLELIVESDGSDSTQTATVARRLVDRGAKALIMITTNTGVVQAKPVFEETKTVAISPVALLPAIADPPDNSYSYMLANPTLDQAKVFIGAFQKLGVKRLAIFHDAVAGMVTLTDTFKAPFKDAGIELVAEEEAAPDASDVTAQVARIKDAKPDAIFVSSLGGQLEMMFHNTAATEMPGLPRFSLASIGNQPASWKLAKPGALDDLRYISSVTTTNPRTAEVAAWLKSVRGDSFQLSAYDVQAYDAINLLVEAIKTAGGVDDPEALRDALNSVKGYKSAFGQDGFTLSFSPEKHLGADGLCGMLLGTFTSDNVPGPPWTEYQPSC